MMLRSVTLNLWTYCTFYVYKTFLPRKSNQLLGDEHLCKKKRLCNFCQ